jgi:HSP20 family protein
MRILAITRFSSRSHKLATRGPIQRIATISTTCPLNHPHSVGFDDFFAPVPFPTREPSLFDLMPVFPDLERDPNSVLLRSSPGFEINESEDKYQIAVDVPGVKASDMTVNLEQEGRVLHITGGRKVVREGTTSETKFEKRFTIGRNVDTEKMAANLSDGVLVLTAPKKEKEEKPVFNIAITEGPAEVPKMIEG